MKKRFMAFCAAIVLCASLSLSGCGNSAGDSSVSSVSRPEDTVKVACVNGTMVGQTVEGVTSFKGVPYAEQPVEALRWKAPQPAQESDEEIECFEFGHTAIQYEWPSEPASYTEKGEDCLSLNIWMSEGTESQSGSSGKPVMVFFHGGAYGWGGTTDPMYDGQNFIADNEDVILVTCNYRLGLMSWADFSDIEGGEEYTDINLGIRDQIASLEWIQENIAAFGGDPDNVTVFGESAGAWSTTALMISPAAEGLFQKVIAESGVVPIKDREEAKVFADYIMEASGAENMDDLLAISAEEWMELDETEWITDECCGVVADGEIIPYPDEVESRMKTAADRGIQLLLGTNHDEWNYFKEDMEGETEQERFDAWVEGMDLMWEEAYEEADDEGKEALDQLIEYELTEVPEQYAEDSEVKEALAKSAFVTETWRYEHFVFADRFVQQGGDVRMYLWEIPSTKDEMYRSAVHAVELAYVFNNTEEDIYAGEVDVEAARKVQESWVNFAKTGDPSIDEAEWSGYDTEDRMTMIIGTDGWSMASDPSKTPRTLLEKAYGDTPYQVW